MNWGLGASPVATKKQEKATAPILDDETARDSADFPSDLDHFLIPLCGVCSIESLDCHLRPTDGIDVFRRLFLLFRDRSIVRGMTPLSPFLPLNK